MWFHFPPHTNTELGKCIGMTAVVVVGDSWDSTNDKVGSCDCGDGRSDEEAVAVVVVMAEAAAVVMMVWCHLL